MVYYTKKASVVKVKIAPMIKNGANGMNRCFLQTLHIPPSIHVNTNVIAKPVVPSHKPPVANNFISPMPIGISAFGFFLCPIQSKTNPIPAPNVYPNVAPIALDEIVQIQRGKNVTTNNPSKNNGNK